MTRKSVTEAGSFITKYTVTSRSHDKVLHVASQVGAKLQAVLQANPKKARPSLRKSSSSTMDSGSIKESSPEKFAYESHRALHREVWEIEDSDTEVVQPKPAMASKNAADDVP